MTGLRVGLYLITSRGEAVFTSFDTDTPEQYQAYGVRQPGEYTSRCRFPPDLLNEGRYVVGVNASSYRIRRYFQDEQAISFTVDATGAPGTQWAEVRMGAIRPRLEWTIEHDQQQDGTFNTSLPGPRLAREHSQANPLEEPGVD